MNKLKKIIPTFVLIFLSVDFTAQTSYHKMLGDTNRWFVSGFIPAVKLMPSVSTSSLGYPCASYYSASKDSLLNGRKYKLFKKDGNVWLCMYSGGNSNIDINNILIREDTLSRKIFMIHPDSTNFHESVCMDFSMNIGDSIYLPFSTQSYALKNGYYKLDSIASKAEILGLRKHFYLTNRLSPVNFNTNKKYFIEWIESIGAYHFPINIVDSDWGSMPFSNICKNIQYQSYVTCKFTNNVKQFQDSCSLKITLTSQNSGYVYYVDNCEYISTTPGAIHEYDLLNSIKISSNPFINELAIEFKEKINSSVELSLMDIYGNTVIIKQVSQTEIPSKTIINTTVLNKGIYLLKVKTGNTTVGYKLIKAE